jgi:hypothetical protein
MLSSRPSATPADQLRGTNTLVGVRGDLEAVAIEPLAAGLGVTKGSIYPH